QAAKSVLVREAALAGGRWRSLRMASREVICIGRRQHGQIRCGESAASMTNRCSQCSQRPIGMAPSGIAPFQEVTKISPALEIYPITDDSNLGPGALHGPQGKSRKKEPLRPDAVSPYFL